MTYHVYINTAKTEDITVSLEATDGTKYAKSVSSTIVRSQSVLPTIEGLMNDHRISWSDIVEVHVATGPGSFTGLRVGATVGATIAWILSLPINGNPPGTMPNLEYGEDKWKLEK